ncbi:3'-phosphoesterase [Mumia sp. zg.B17]|uniref:DNA polymerase ligase N-terminal domain-containing protein n=1 Tax=Mumia sp. zg.B17 TaxID=2855446 RepID=UPI001C6E33D3|nr:DNA polymerase ligase N-terminal domain-containing protein [Mumia sp. zg.B17]MBW9206646.1 3'-phosphoesterase [Mumia sp. zg.B17]
MLYVCQRHHARVLHHDLRLEVAGVLVSWAVPKGPSPDPSVRRLAIRTDDHDLAHATYEGAYARDGSRPGSVIVWDSGTYDHLTTRAGTPVSAGDALADGHLVVDLHGRRLSGPYALTRTGEAGGKEQWILVKMRGPGVEAGADPARDGLTSVLSGRTNAELERAFKPSDDVR